MAKGGESQEETVKENIQEHNPPNDGMETGEIFDRDTRLDFETLHHFESQFEPNMVDQLSSSCCYGRGKALADIFVPRLPKKFQDENYDVADHGSFDWRLASQSYGHGSTQQQPARGCGRGKMLELQSISLQAEKIRPGDQESTEQLPVHISPVKSTCLLYSQTSCDSVLSESSTDTHFYARSANSTSPTYSVESQRDFPSLSSSDTSSARSNHRLRAKRGQRRQMNGKNHSQDSLPSEAFEDAEKDPRSLGELAEIALSDSAQFNSENLTCITAADMASASQGTIDYTNNSVSSSDVDSSECPVSAFDGGNETDFKSARLKRSPDIQNTGSSSSILAESSLVPAVADLPDVGDIDDIGAKGADVTQGMSASGDGTNTLGSEKQEASEDISMSGSRDDSHLDGDASDSECKAAAKSKKKSRTNWKLDGPLVVHVENVPKNRGGELKTHVEAFGKIVDSEKKSKKGANAWRFRLESIENCKYIVECLHGEVVFEGCSSVVECYCLGEITDEGTQK